MIQVKRFFMRVFPLGVLASVSFCALQYASAAEQSTVEVLGAAVAKPLELAQQAIRKLKWNVALDDIKKAQSAQHKSAKDEYSIDELLGYILYRQNKYDQAATVYERQLESGLMPANQIEERTKAIAYMYFRIGNYRKAEKWAKTALESHPEQTSMAELLGESYFRTMDYKDAAATMKRVVSEAERAKQKPKESWLRIIDNSYYKLNDSQGIKYALSQLVRYYRRPEDWSALAGLYLRDVQDDRVAFGYRYLMFDLNVLTRAGDYEDMIFEAVDANVPADAQLALERGKKSGVFAGPDSLPGRYERLQKLVQKKTAAADEFLSQFAAKSAGATTGRDDVVAGQMYLSDGRYDKAIDALRRGIEKGGVSDIDNAHISLGIAYLKQGQIQLADQAFHAVGKESKWSGLAELWLLRADNASSAS